MSIAVLGEALIDFIVDESGAYRPHLGGSPYNVAIGLARQGMEVSYLSPLSDDTFGDRLRDSLEREGVRLPIRRRSLCPTSLALVAVDDEGIPSYRLYREGIADKDTSFEEIAANLPPELKIFHTGSLAITPSQLPKIRRLFDFLHTRLVLISIDVNIRLRASIDTEAYLQGVRSLLPLADIVKASDEDLGALKLADNARDAAAIAYGHMGSGILVLTEGRGGALLIHEQGEIEKRAYPIAKVKDTIGAGDTFHSALLAALMRGGVLDDSLGERPQGVLGDAVDFAGAAAAINVSRAGCSPPTKLEVDQFIESRRG